MSRGIVLQVAIGGDDEPPARVFEASGERRGLAEVPPESDDPHLRIRRLQPRQDLEAPVGAAIVDEDDFVGARPDAERRRQLAVQILERLSLVADRNDDAQLDHGVRSFYRLLRACAFFHTK
jgi:hypothetical protein